MVERALTFLEREASRTQIRMVRAEAMVERDRTNLSRCEQADRCASERCRRLEILVDSMCNACLQIPHLTMIASTAPVEACIGLHCVVCGDDQKDRNLDGEFEEWSEEEDIVSEMNSGEDSALEDDDDTLHVLAEAAHGSLRSSSRIPSRGSSRNPSHHSYMAALSASIARGITRRTACEERYAARATRLEVARREARARQRARLKESHVGLQQAREQERVCGEALSRARSARSRVVLDDLASELEHIRARQARLRRERSAILDERRRQQIVRFEAKFKKLQLEAEALGISSELLRPEGTSGDADGGRTPGECQVCFHEYAAPVRARMALGCGHQLCAACLDRLKEDEASDEGLARCPTCRAIVVQTIRLFD